MLNGSLPKLIIHDTKLSTEILFKKIKKAKISYRLEDLCSQDLPTECLTDFIKTSFSYRFNDAPNYKILHNHLE